MNQRHCLISPKVPRYYVVVIVLEYSELKIVSLRNVDTAIESKETIISVHPSWIARVSKVFLSYSIRCQISYDVGVTIQILWIKTFLMSERVSGRT